MNIPRSSIPTDMLEEISNHLNLKSIIMLYATTLNMNHLCDDQYWKRLYHQCYRSKYYKSKQFTLSQYKYKNATNTLANTLILHRKYTDKEYVMMYYAVKQLSKKYGIKLKVNGGLIMHSANVSTFYPEFSNLFMYKSLDLYNNSLGIIPPSIGKMTNLKELNLSLTNISHLPKEIGLLIKLKTLDLDNNNISDLPIEIGLLGNLTYLDCSYNQLTCLPKEMANITKLKRLYLHNNQLVALPDMTALINLKDISLIYNDLSFNDVKITSPKLNQSSRNMLNSL